MVSCTTLHLSADRRSYGPSAGVDRFLPWWIGTKRIWSAVPGYARNAVHRQARIPNARTERRHPAREQQRISTGLAEGEHSSLAICVSMNSGRRSGSGRTSWTRRPTAAVAGFLEYAGWTRVSALSMRRQVASVVEPTFWLVKGGSWLTTFSPSHQLISSRPVSVCPGLFACLPPLALSLIIQADAHEASFAACRELRMSSGVRRIGWYR